MEEHCPQQGLPERENIVIVAINALSQVTQVLDQDRIAYWTVDVGLKCRIVV